MRNSRSTLPKNFGQPWKSIGVLFCWERLVGGRRQQLDPDWTQLLAFTLLGFSRLVHDQPSILSLVALGDSGASPPKHKSSVTVETSSLP